MIRKYKQSDLPFLIKVFNKNIPNNFAESELEDLITYLKKNSETYFCIEKEGIIVGGFGYLILEGQESASIKWIFIHPEFVGFGLGKLAVERCLQIFRELPEIKKVIVDTSQLANKFFAGFDFNTIDHIKDYWGKDLDLIKMELQLL